MQTFDDYSAHLKNFYHHFILCDKQYTTTTAFQQNLSHMGYTIVSHRGSFVPHPPHNNQFRTSTI